MDTTKVKKGLGRGLSSLIGESKAEINVNKILISDLLSNKFQPRKIFDESSLQDLANSIKERGIILCICSKNDESIAKRPFLDHPDMILSLKDIAIFIANWDNKVTNIQKIKQVLNIDYDSILFIDDNPVERDMGSYLSR